MHKWAAKTQMSLHISVTLLEPWLLTYIKYASN